MTARAAVLFACVAGCWRDPPPAAPEPPPPPPQTATIRSPPTERTPCELAIDHVLDLGQDQLDPVIATNRAAARATSVESCQEMRWAGDVIRCLQDLPTIDELRRCQEQLTPEQVADILRRIGELASP